MGFRYPQPDNEVAFEQFCLRYYRKLWTNESLQLYAKRGEKQDGIDIHDPYCLKPVRAVQCKHHEPTKALSRAEIMEEVGKVEKSNLSIQHYVIATTAKKSKKAQDTVVELNARSDSEKKFTVEVHFWDHICNELSGLPQIQAHFIVEGRDASADLIASVLKDREIFSIASNVLRNLPTENAAGAFYEIDQLFKDRKFDAARHELDKLPAGEELTKLDAEEKYKIHRLRGKLALETGAFDIAAQHFLAAYELCPNLEQAKLNQVLAYSLIPDPPKAYKFASKYVSEGILNPTILCRLIENAASLEQINEHISLINSYTENDQDINIALCHKLLRFDDIAGGKEAAKRALAMAPDSPHAHFAGAISAHNDAFKGDWRERKENLKSALSHYDVAEKWARKNNYRQLLPEILINRAAAKVLSGDLEAAAMDYRASVDAASSPSLYATAAVSFFLNQHKYSAASELLNLLEHNTEESNFLRAITEFNNAKNDQDRRRIFDQLKRLADRDWSRAVECRLVCVTCGSLLKDRALAESCIDEKFLTEHPLQANTALAVIALEFGDKTSSHKYAKTALEQSMSGTHVQDLRILARALIQLDQHGEALDLLEQVATPGILNDDMKWLIDCAQQLERHDLLLRICRELRETGEQDDKVQRMELQLLNRYAPEQGLILANEFITASPKPAYYIACKNVFAVRLNQLVQVQLEPSQLPTPAELSPMESRLVTMPYVAAHKFDDALRFLYSQLRLYFDDEHAHGQYVAYILSYGEQTSLRQPPEKVEVNTAVLLEPEHGDKRWVIIENDNPVPSRGEFPQSAELAKCLMGHALGDVIDLPAGAVRSEKVTIREIQTKYIRAFQDSMKHFHERFPGTSFLQQFHVGSGDDFDPTPIVETLRHRREFVDKCVEFYKSHPCSLHLFATQIGISELEAVKALVHHSGAIVKCCDTTPNDFERAVGQGLQSDILVLDISSIITLTLLDGWDCLDTRKRYVVSQATRELVEEWLSLADSMGSRAEEGGHLSVTDDGKLLFQEDTKARRDTQLGELTKMKEMIETKCEFRSSENVAAVDPEKRRVYEEFAGFHGLETINLAKELNALLWSDDLVLSVCAGSDFSVKPVWTQLVFRFFLNSGHLSIEDYNLATAKLASWNYVQTLWNPGTIVRAAEYAEWNPQQWPLKQCIELISNSSQSMPFKASVALGCLKLLRSSSCSQLLQSPIIQAILSAIGNRRAVAWMRERLDEVFGVDIASVHFLKPKFEYWLGSHLG